MWCYHSRVSAWRRPAIVAAVLVCAGVQFTACDPGQSREHFVYAGFVESTIHPGSLRLLIDCEALKKGTTPGYTDIALRIWLSPIGSKSVSGDQEFQVEFKKMSNECPCSIELEEILQQPGLVRQSLVNYPAPLRINQVGYFGFGLDQFGHEGQSPAERAHSKGYESQGIYELSSSPSELDPQRIRSTGQPDSVARSMESFGCSAK